MSESTKPSPGSDAALALGCQCPVMDNARGRGCGMRDEQGKPLFWISEGCPLHAPKPEPRPVYGEDLED